MEIDEEVFYKIAELVHKNENGRLSHIDLIGELYDYAKQLQLYGVVVPKGTLSCGCKDHLTVTFTSDGEYCGNCGKLIPTT